MRKQLLPKLLSRRNSWGRIVWLSAGSETELLHRPRDSGSGSTDRHYSTIHSVTQSYVTKAFHLQAHCGNPAILIAAARYPLQSIPPVGVLDRPRSPHSAPPPTAARPPLRPRESLFCVPELRIFPVLRIPLSYGSVLCWQQSTPRFRPPCPAMQTRRTGGCFQTLLRAAKRNPKRASKMFAGTRDVF